MHQRRATTPDCRAPRVRRKRRDGRVITAKTPRARRRGRNRRVCLLGSDAAGRRVYESDAPAVTARVIVHQRRATMPDCRAPRVRRKRRDGRVITAKTPRARRRGRNRRVCFSVVTRRAAASTSLIREWLQWARRSYPRTTAAARCGRKIAALPKVLGSALKCLMRYDPRWVAPSRCSRPARRANGLPE